MEIYVADSAGFCFGVNRAIECVYNQLNKGKLYTYGSIIHNKEVIADLESKGVVVADQMEDIEEGTVIIRSHGVAPDIYKAIEEKQLQSIDCTCPYVKRIHKIVEKCDKEKGQIIIVGSPNHPEIQGIHGWAGFQSVIIENEEAAKIASLPQNKTLYVVAQTTYRQEKFDSIITILRNRGFEVIPYETICNATAVRQKEAVEIAKKVDKMIIIGDKGSSNTQKLYEICRKHCDHTFYIETIQDLQLKLFDANDKIGITAGASTPSAIIKEVISTMSENHESFEQLLENSIVTLHTGKVVKGTVIQVTNDEVSVNLGYKSDGMIPRSELSNDPNVNPMDIVKLGDEIEVFVVRVNDGDGNVLLSKKKVDAQKGWDVIEEAYNNKAVVEGKVVEVVKGGVIAIVNEIRVFIPSSQLSNRYVEDLNTFKGKDIKLQIIECDKTKRRIVGGRKQLAEQEMNEKKEKVFDTISQGQKLTGTVSRLTDFGAFVDLGGVDGLIHISEMSWGRIEHPRDAVKEGQTVEVLVMDVDKVKGKISLTMKDPAQNPWAHASEKYAVGSVVEGKVVRMVPFGAFVELEPGIDGLVHISQIAAKHVVKPEDELTIGQKVEVKVLDLNIEDKKISLSKKEADGVAVEAEETVEQPANEEINE